MDFIPEKSDLSGDYRHVVLSWEKESASHQGTFVVESILTKDKSLDPQEDAVLDWRLECSISHGNLHPLRHWAASSEGQSHIVYDHDANTEALKRRLKEIAPITVAKDHTLQIWQDPERAFPGRSKWRSQGKAPEQVKKEVRIAQRNIEKAREEKAAEDLAKKQMGFGF